MSPNFCRPTGSRTLALRWWSWGSRTPRSAVAPCLLFSIQQGHSAQNGLPLKSSKSNKCALAPGHNTSDERCQRYDDNNATDRTALAVCVSIPEAQLFFLPPEWGLDLRTPPPTADTRLLLLFFPYQFRIQNKTLCFRENRAVHHANKNTSKTTTTFYAILSPRLPRARC